MFFLLASNSLIINAETITRSCDLTSADTESVSNSGRGYGPLAAKFPFSGRVIAALESSRDAILDATVQTDVDVVFRATKQAAISTFGTTIASEMEKHTMNEPRHYLHDFIASVPQSVPGLALHEHCAVAGCIFECVNASEAVEARAPEGERSTPAGMGD